MAHPIIHGMSHSRLYRIWTAMKRRCYDQKTKAFRDYGARGVQVCEEWRAGFIPFRDWALANGYDDTLTIDRYPDRNGNYEPSNCRWATPEAQSANRDCTKLVCFRGEMIPISQLARRFGLKRTTLRARLSANWDPDRAVTTQPRHWGR